MWAQAARDRDALEADLSLRHEEERSRFLEEANERASQIVEEVRELSNYFQVRGFSSGFLRRSRLFRRCFVSLSYCVSRLPSACNGCCVGAVAGMAELHELDILT